MKKFFKKVFSRFSFVAITIVLFFIMEFTAVIGLVFALDYVLSWAMPNLGKIVNACLVVTGWLIVAVTVIHCANRDMVPETKVPWLLCIVILNIFGVAIYVVFSANRPSKKQRKLYRCWYDRMKGYTERKISAEEGAERLGNWAAVSEALYTEDRFAVLHGGTKTEYFSSGEEFCERFLGDLEGAKDFIFMEYFIIAKGRFWTRLLEILKKKVSEGVEVRLIYDDVGSMSRVRAGYHRALKKAGIKCVKFSPFVPVVTTVHNNRDHRKITVIDGKIGYTGGINLADEYFNLERPYGHWKDSAVRLEGEGVRNFTVMFMLAYHLRDKKKDRFEAEDFSRYIPEAFETFEGEGFVQPYGDAPRPLSDNQVGEDVYINILNGAKKYVWITTPYLIIDYRLRGALMLAAERGVDVRIVTPHIPDKRLPFALTRSNYLALIKKGVKIYEYTPGFVHAKNFLADDEAGVVGTINLDYRSLMHHYEDAVFMCGTKALVSLKKDFEETFAVSKRISEEDAKKNVVSRGLCALAKVFAPLF